MPTDRAVLCGAAPGGRLPVADPDPLRLSLTGDGANVRLAVEAVRRAMVRAVPPAFTDLLELAAYVYAADQSVSRGGRADLGGRWRRRFFFRVPVRAPDVWTRPAVRDALRTTLGFLSDDEYEFEFLPAGPAGPIQQYLEMDPADYDGVADEVILFSGGLDSLGGAVEEAVVQHRRVVLVGHRSNPKPDVWQRELVRMIQKRAGDAAPIFLPVLANKSEGLTHGYTQRARSFLYAALGAAVAVLLNKDRVRFYENGVVSFNLPVSPQVIGGRASRTTHPKVLAGFARLFSELAGMPFAVENPFLWNTKTDIVRGIAAAGCGDMIRHSVSCAHTWTMRKETPHCGACSQCIDRRFAVLAAGRADDDPAAGYRVDLMTGERAEGEPRAMLAGYLDTATRVERMTEAEFYTRFGEAARALRSLPGGATEVARKVFDLHFRHAREVTGVVDRSVREFASQLWRGDLPPGCLIRFVLPDAGPMAAEEPSISVEPTPANVFRWKGRGWEVRFRGGPVNILPESVGASYLHALLSRPGRGVSVVELSALTSGRPVGRLGDAGERADPDALAAYKARAAELRDEREEALADNDPGRADRARDEIAVLAGEVSRATGRGGRLRKDADDRTRVRSKVGNALRRVAKEIAGFDKPLADHLKSPWLQGGFHPCYTPPPDVTWEV